MKETERKKGRGRRGKGQQSEKEVVLEVKKTSAWGGRRRGAMAVGVGESISPF